MNKFGQMIFTYRKLHGISQEELARTVGVSAGAVSKWERDISIPDLEILCSLADYFQISLDELIGRKKQNIADIQFDNEWEMNRYFVALELLECCKVARSKGLIAVEEAVEKKEESAYSFLKFAIHFLMDGLKKNRVPEESKAYLIKYAEAEKDKRTAQMVCEVIVLIFSGENEDIVKEVICSFLGRRYAGLVLHDKLVGRQEMIEDLSSYELGYANTNILDELITQDDYHIQLMLKQINNDEFIYAFLGATKEIRIRLLQNLSDRMISFVGEEIKKCDITPEQIMCSQKRMIDIINSLDE